MIGLTRKTASLDSDAIEALIEAKVQENVAAMNPATDALQASEAIEALIDAKVEERLATLLPDLLKRSMPAWLRRMPALLSEADLVRAVAGRHGYLRVEVDSEGTPVRWLDSEGCEVRSPASDILRLAEEASRSLGLDSNYRASRDPFAEAIESARRAAISAGTPAGLEALKRALVEHLQDLGRATVVEAG